MHNKLFPARRNVSSVRTVAAFSFLLTLVACSQDAEFGSPQTASDTSVSDGETEPTQPAEVPSPTPLPTPAKTASADDTTGTEKQKPEQGEVKWTSLFNGKNLDGWKNTEFGGEGEITVEKEQLILDMGTPLSGVNYTGKIPKINYEVELDAMRVTGTDFFCGLTFPVKKDPCSLIIGGWGGGVMGLSSLNGMDASENETTNYMEFKNGQWYHIRLRVLSDRITAWIDGKEIVDQDITDRKISVRIEVELSKPFGFATYETRAALRKIRIRELSEDEITAAKSTPAELERE
jgi:hypothetical protein